MKKQIVSVTGNSMYPSILQNDKGTQLNQQSDNDI